MCGIVGIFDPLSKFQNKKKIIRDLNTIQTHRGPDDSGYYDGGYYIELEGLNSTELSGNISVEMVLQNHNRDRKGLYFSRTNSATELTKYGPTLVARYSTKIDGIKFSARTRSTEELNRW